MLSPRGLRQGLAETPVIGRWVNKILRWMKPGKPEAFVSSSNYWKKRYAKGGNSGPGSYGRLAVFKADVINEFVTQHDIRTVIEFGCGDGAQLELAKYPDYMGIDISLHAIALCKTKFGADAHKRFFLSGSPEANHLRAELVLSLDVIYHLVEEDAFHNYMRAITAAGQKYLCIYSSDYDATTPASHIRHWSFSNWLNANAPEWKLVSTVPNPYPDDPNDPDNTTWADIFFFSR